MPPKPESAMRPMYVFTVLALILIALVVVLTKSSTLPPDAVSLLRDAIIGILTLIGVVVNFEFGSSKGSQAKDVLLAAATPPLVNQAKPETTPHA